MKPVLSVIVLCYHAEEHARELIPPLLDELAADGPPHEVVLVANYWSEEDGTPAVVAELAAGRDDVRAVAERKRGGMGWDLRAGLRVARGEFLVFIDGDGQVPMRYALEAYRQLRRSSAPIVKGRRRAREDGSVRTLTSIGYNLLFRIVFGTTRIWDVNGRPKGMTRAAYETLDLATDDWFTDAEIVLKARHRGLEVHEFPVRFLKNPVRGSFVGASTVVEFLRNISLWRLGRHPAQRRRAAVVAPRHASPSRAKR